MNHLSKRQIGLLGDRIRKAYGDGTGIVPKEDLEMLQEYRLTFRDTIASVFAIVYKECQAVNKNSIITYRIKRIESIIGKLKRMPKTQLDRLIDIAGCRCILSNDEQVYRLLTRLRENPNIYIKKEIDYIKTPQTEGYKSIHLYVGLSEGDGKLVEIQLRNQEQHNWATLVEITDFVFETKLKEYKEPAELLEFHRLLSVPEQDLSQNEKKKLFQIIKNTDYINKINSVFVKNYIDVRMQWMQLQSNSKNSFYLIEAKRNDCPQIDSYNSFFDAEKAYFERFQQNSNSNIVLTNIPHATYEQISIAYSNYMLSTHSFSDNCLNRYQRQIRECLEHKKYIGYARYYSQYCKTLACSLRLLKAEIDTLNKNVTKENKHKIKVKEWIKDINIKAGKIINKQNVLSSIYKHTIDRKSFFYYYCGITTLIINKRCFRSINNE
jgi:ppGpp synthetase/RelA/SpoT-type nucleotidyltranferase